MSAKINRKEAVSSGPLDCLEKRHEYTSIEIRRLQELRDYAWEKAIKYRFDPVIGKMHTEYLEALNLMIEVMK